MSKRSKNRFTPYQLAALLTVLALLVFTMCMTILQVDQPSEVNAGEIFRVTLDVEVSNDDDSGDPFYLVVGFLAPRTWAPAQNTSVRFESTVGNSTMRLATDSDIDGETKLRWTDVFPAKFGIGENYGEVGWVVFIADEAFPAPDGATGQVILDILAGEENLITQLGYGISNTTWGTGNDNFDIVFTDCIEVVNGQGFALNLCGSPPRQLVDLETYTFEDLITISFDATEGDDGLVGASRVYFCSTATAGEITYQKCETIPISELQFFGNDLWKLTFWPRSYYGIPDGVSIDFIECTFRNTSGNIEITNPDGSPFIIGPKCFD